MDYKKPVLIEILTEIYLESNTITTENFFDLATILKSKGYTKVEMGQFGLNIQPNAGSSLVPRIRCWNEQKDNLIQISPDLLIMNRVGEYLGWADYRNLFNVGYGSLKEMFGTPKVLSMKLHTVDDFVVPKEAYTFGKYINCGGDKIPAWYKECKEALDITMGKGVLNSDHFNRQIKIAVRPNDSAISIRIDSVFHDTNDQDDEVKLLESLHREAVDSFESMITVNTKEGIMGGKK